MKDESTAPPSSFLLPPCEAGRSTDIPVRSRHTEFSRYSSALLYEGLGPEAFPGEPGNRAGCLSPVALFWNPRPVSPESKRGIDRDMRSAISLPRGQSKGLLSTTLSPKHPVCQLAEVKGAKIGCYVTIEGSANLILG